MERQTRQHRAIFEAFANAGRPLLPQEVLDKASEEAPRLSIATVYRNIKNLLEDGQLRMVELPGQNPRYEMAGLSHHHYFQCRKCNRVFDVEKCPGNLVDLAPPGFKVDGHEIVLYGQCRDCSSETN